MANFTSASAAPASAAPTAAELEAELLEAAEAAGLEVDEDGYIHFHFPEGIDTDADRIWYIYAMMS